MKLVLQWKMQRPEMDLGSWDPGLGYPIDIHRNLTIDFILETF